jgi:hypothetical protein
MKTPEDEAFEDIERRQGGFKAKQAMAADKLQRPAQTMKVEGPVHVVCQCEKCKAQPAQEPVAWTLLLTDEHHGIIGKAGKKFIGAPECYQRVDVYTTPPKREWVGLTQKEVQEIHDTYHKRMGPQEFASMLEAKLKEKNT